MRAFHIMNMMPKKMVGMLFLRRIRTWYYNDPYITTFQRNIKSLWIKRWQESRLEYAKRKSRKSDLQKALKQHAFYFTAFFNLRTSSLLVTGATVPRGNGVRWISMRTEKFKFLLKLVNRPFCFYSQIQLLAEYQYAVMVTHETNIFVLNAIQSVRKTVSTAYVFLPTVKSSSKYD